MIKLDDHRKRNLEMMFSSTTDRDLIHELVRRGRLRQTQANAMYYPEMEQDERYMEHIKHRVLSMVARHIADDKEQVFPALFAETRPDHPKGSASLTADIVYLVARRKEENR